MRLTNPRCVRSSQTNPQTPFRIESLFLSSLPLLPLNSNVLNILSSNPKTSVQISSKFPRTFVIESKSSVLEWTFHFHSMAASANPSGVHSNGNYNSGVQENTNGGNLSATDNSLAGPTQTALRHNPGLSHDWTPEEQSTLEDLLTKYASETNIIRYAIIAQALKDKTVRDVALRCRWMSKKESGKRRKDDNSSRKSKEKKEKAIDSFPKSSQVANHSNGPPYLQPVLTESDDGISYKAIGGATGQLLEQNANALDQISANFSALKIRENIELFCQARTNILSILNDFSDLPEIMKQMPPLPVKLNEDLANSVLPRTPLANKS